MTEKDATSRPKEALVLALLEQVICLSEEAEHFIQDDGRITGDGDREEICYRMIKIRSLTLEIERALGAR
jgi:hypothetical protein